MAQRLLKNRWFRLSTSLFLALGVATSTYFLDRGVSERRVHDDLKLLTRQLAHQVEAMASTQRDRSPSDGLRLSVSRLNQAPEPRVVTLALWETKAGARAEEFEIKGTQAIYSYVVFPTEGLGLRLTYERGFRGFLGTKNRLSSDLSFLAFVLVLAFAMSRWIRPGQASSSETSHSEALATPVTETPAWPDHRDRMAKGKVRLVELGGNVRGIVRNAHLMTVRSGKIRLALQRIESSLKTEMERLSEVRVKSKKQLEKPFSDAEMLALNVVLEAGRLGAKGAAIAAAADQLQKHLLGLKKLSAQSNEELLKAEQAMEPIVESSRTAIEAVSEVVKASHQLGQPLKKTTESLGEYSKLFDEAV